MRVSAVLLSFVLLQAGSDALPIRPSRVNPVADPSSLRLSESPLSAEQLADKEYKDGRTDKYVGSTMTHLFDQHDIVPEEHTYWGPDTPFNIGEYFTINPPGETNKSGWKKIWEGIQDLFPPSNKLAGGELDAGVMTTYGTDGTAKEDMVSSFAPGKRKCKGLGWSCGADAKKKYTMHGAKGFR